MLRIQYTQWDGTQRVRLDADRVFEKLSEYLSYTDDVDEALDWLMRQGAEWGEMRVAGLDDLLDRVREQIRQRQEQLNLDRALDDPRRRLEEALDLERGTRGEGEASSLPDRVPRELTETLQRLRHHDWADEDARRDVEGLLEGLDDIHRLEEFIRRNRELFQGPRALDYDEALELMHEMERLQQLENALASGDLEQVPTDVLGEMLGAEAAQDFRHLQQMMAVLAQSGHLRQREGRTTLSPKGVRRIGQLALRDIYHGLLRDRSGRHGTSHRGPTEVRIDETRSYAYGDPMNLDLVRTLGKALARRPGTPLRLQPDDFEVYATDLATQAATVLLLDMSWSMSWEGRFAAAKKVAMAMESLVRTRFPRDYFAVVGFYTRAVEIRPKELPEASWNMGDPFTNLQDGLRKATDLLDRHRTPNRHVIVITDGQPTAYFSGGRLYCEWPLSFGGISMRAAQETLKEVERVTRKGITINTFMLDDSPSLRAFVEKMTRINRGRALYTRPDHLGEYMLVDYLGKKRKKLT